MNTKEAIKYLDDLQDENFELQEEYNNKRILKVINLLKRGEKLKVENKELEKYKAIWREFNHYPHITIKNVRELINELEQKHFPRKIRG